MMAEPEPPAANAAPRRIALVMIARDEAAQIGRALASARPWVDEMLVLDTGSTDATAQLARQAGARVARFNWVNDFSAARNAALALADADWHLVLDADEWLAQGGEALASLRHLAPEFVGQVRVDSLQGAGGQTSAPSWISRLLPGPVRYAGAVHEQPVHAWPVRQLPVIIGHSGYLPEALQRKAGRNGPLLEKAVAQAPQEAYLWFQLGKDHDVYERYAQALQCFDRAAALRPSGPEPKWMHDLMVRSLHALKRCGRHAEGLQRAEAALRPQPIAGSPEPRSLDYSQSPDFFFALGDLLLDWAAEDPSRASALLPLMESAWERCLLIGERPDLEGSVAGRGSHLAASNLALLSQIFGTPLNAANAAHERT